jgi:hypothetical protein
MNTEEHIHAEIAHVKASLAGLDGRVEQVEGQLANTLLAVLKGLKGSDDGTTDGLYEGVRKLRVEQSAMHQRIEGLATTVAQHEKDKNEVVGGARTLHLLVVLGSGLLAWLITHLSK